MKKQKPLKVEIQFNAPGLRAEFMTELRRRAKWRGKRGAQYRQILKAARAAA
jgi:hypothetical protein